MKIVEHLISSGKIDINSKSNNRDTALTLGINNNK